MGVGSGFCGEVSTEVIQGQTESQLACHQRLQREQLASTGLLQAVDGMAVLSYTERVTAFNRPSQNPTRGRWDSPYLAVGPLSTLGQACWNVGG